MSKLGHLDGVDAFEFVQYLCLVGRGTRPTLGWTSWFAPIHVMPNTYEFLQEPPRGLSIHAVIPLQIVGIFTSNGVKEVVVRHLANGRPNDKHVPVRPISPMQQLAVSTLISPSTLSYLRTKGTDRTMPPVGTSFTMQLGTVDVPFACGTWNDPLRARRYEIHLNVDALLPGLADIEMAVQDCFKRQVVADALATLLTPTGWPAGLAAFKEEVEAGLLASLGDKLVNVRVTTFSHCLESESATRIRAPTIPSVS